MLQIILFVIILILASSAWKTLRSMVQQRTEDIFAAQQGCLPIKTIFSGHLPFGLDLVRGLYTAHANQHLLSYLQSFIEEMGPSLELRMIGNAGLVTVDPENIKAVLSKSRSRDGGDLDWVYGTRRDALMPLFGEGIFTQDGLRWKHSREMLRKQFTRIQYHNLDIFTEQVELLVNRLSNMRSSIVDLQPLFLDFTLDTTTSLLFGESAGSLRAEATDEFGRNLTQASWISAIRVELAYLYWVCCPPQYFRSCRRVKEYADRWVRKALDGDKGTRDGKSREGSGRYEFIRNLYDELKDRNLVREQLVNVLLAGRDTTACLLSWTFRLLLRHPNALMRLREEIEAVLEGDTCVAKAELQKMPFLNNVMTETLRLYPSVPVNFRNAGRTTVLPRGGGPDGLAPLFVKKGMGIGFSPYHMHRRKDLYGEDALSFRPERWEDESLQERIGWGYLPFNGGPRICLGQEFALLEASYAVVRIMQSFPDLALPVDEKVEQIGAERQSLTLTLAPTDGCRVRLNG